MDLKNINFQNLGKIPIISTFTGLVRIVRGIVRYNNFPIDLKITRSGVKRWQTGEWDSWDKCEYKYERDRDFKILGMPNPSADVFANERKCAKMNGRDDIVRGLIEIVPIIGNLAMVIYDKKRTQ